MFANGDKYIGQWREGKQHGTGKLIYANGDIFEGKWNNDRIHGSGIEKLAGGIELGYQYKDGELLRHDRQTH